MGTSEIKGKNKKPAKSGLERSMEGMLERIREALEKLVPNPQPTPVPIPVPVPTRRLRRR
jgi:hypothetical protein